jgi:predicted nicotinamide N-methyase
VIDPSPEGRRAFILANTTLQAPPHTPELNLHLADEITPIWRMTEEALEQIGLPPPFWAFAWAGGQALARYVLDHPDSVKGRRVLDLASGSGLVAIAAARAGAAPVVASDIDPIAETAIALNTAANGTCADVTIRDMLDDPAPPVACYDVILVGDLFYEQGTAARTLAFLERHAALGAEVLIGDPSRTYLPKDRLRQIEEYRIPVTRELEDQEIKRTAVWTLRDR